ncbi:MAG TPA: carboxymuconolactone decarboxylase family protein [Anaerolineales bacterium]|nr:carboxymuconolactone decarboxylase family protein [Anaerolineales bacterium]
MPTVEILTQKEKELVAVAASIASGCIPCTVHHTKAVREAGASEAEVLGAIRIALDVLDYATEMMAEAAHGNLNYAYPDGTQSGSVEQPIDNLIAMGATFACNSVAGVEYYWTKAKAAGASTRQMLVVIRIVRGIKKDAVEKTDTMFGSLLDPNQSKAEIVDKQEESVSSSCCCS